MPNTYYKGGGGGYIAHASKHADGGDDEITLPLDLGAIPTNLVGKNADKVDGYHAGNEDGKVLVLPTATQGQILKRGASNWTAETLQLNYDISWRRFIKPNAFYPLPPHKPGSVPFRPLYFYVYAVPFILPGGINISQIAIYKQSQLYDEIAHVGIYSDTGNFSPYLRLWWNSTGYMRYINWYYISIDYSVPTNTKLWLACIFSTGGDDYLGYSSSDIIQPYFRIDLNDSGKYITQLRTQAQIGSLSLYPDLSNYTFIEITDNAPEFLFKLVYV